MTQNQSFQISAGYYKAGEDFRNYLTKNQGNVVAALRDWADNLSSFANNLREITVPLEGKDVSGFGDAHAAMVYCDEETLHELMNKNLVLLPEEIEENYERHISHNID